MQIEVSFYRKNKDGSMSSISPPYALKFLDACSIASLYQLGKLSARDVIELSAELAREEQKNIFIDPEDKKRAGIKAHISDLQLKMNSPRHMFEGIPVAWKDIFHRKGKRVTAGRNPDLIHETQKKSAPVYEIAESYGLTSIGSTNLSELAFSGVGLNSHNGSPENIYSKGQKLIPGGSSSGSAASVAYGITPIAVGTDTSGSIRVPASMQNLVGFKPSSGRYPSDGCIPLAPSLDTIGFLSRSVRDCIILDDMFRGGIKPNLEQNWASFKKREQEKVDIAPLTKTIFVPKNYVWDNASQATIDRFKNALHLLESSGYSIVKKDIKTFDRVATLFKDNGTLVAFEAGREHASRSCGEQAKLLDPYVARRLKRAAEMSDCNGAILLSYRKELIRELEKELAGGMLTFPTVAIDIPSIVDVQKNMASFNHFNSMCLKNTMIGSFLNTPGISLPLPMEKGDLPLGFLLSSIGGKDRELLWEADTIFSVINQKYVRRTQV